MFCFLLRKEHFHKILFNFICLALFVCWLNHSDMIIEIRIHGDLLLFHFVSVLSITNREKQEKIEYTIKYQIEQFSPLANSKNFVK